MGGTISGRKTHLGSILVVAVSVCNSLRMDYCRNDTQCQSCGCEIECYCCNTIGYWYCYISIPSCRGCVGYVWTKRPNFTIAGVLAWAFGWIYSELGNPMPSILETFGSDTVNGVRYAALAVSIIIVGQVVTRVTMDVIQCFTKKRHSGSELSSEKQELKSDE